MNLNLTGDGIELTDALRTFTSEKFLRLQRHYDHIIKAHVVFDMQRMLQNAEATLYVPGGPIHARCESKNLYESIDLLVDKLDKQIKKHKEKQSNHRERK
jgi:putative sigma-54 modulation protein